MLQSQTVSINPHTHSHALSPCARLTHIMFAQGIYDKRQRTEVEMAKRDQELKQLQGWRSTVQSLLERFQELVAQQAAAAQAAAANGTADDAPAAEQAAKADAGATSSSALLLAAQQAVHGRSADRPALFVSSYCITTPAADRESAAAAAEEGRSLYDANGNIDAQAFHAELAKQAAAAQTSQQESTLQKLRQHFQRVRVVACPPPYSPHTHAAPSCVIVLRVMCMLSMLLQPNSSLCRRRPASMRTPLPQCFCFSQSTCKPSCASKSSTCHPVGRAQAAVHGRGRPHLLRLDPERAQERGGAARRRRGGPAAPGDGAGQHRLRRPRGRRRRPACAAAAAGAHLLRD